MLTRNLLSVGLLSLFGCTTFADTNIENIDTISEGSGTDASESVGACCADDRCEPRSAAACATLGGVHTPGATCETVGCAPTCTAYCASFFDTCASVANDYVSLADCGTLCNQHAAWPTGTFEDLTGNTIGCRLYHTTFAADPEQDTAHHCGHAGITGGDVCGTWCVNYCELAASICTGDDELYSSVEECLETCGDFSDDGEIGDTGGNTVQCRIYHLTAAARAPNERSMHCRHASATSVPGTCFGPDIDL